VININVKVMLYKVCKIPLHPPFPKGEISLHSPLWQRGVKGDFIEHSLMRLY
jgi:hypothetical protein